MLVQQNQFMKGKYSRTIAVNCQYYVLFENVRDKLQIRHLARQMYPNKSSVLMEAYRDATKEDYGYLFIDMTPCVDERTRLRTKIFPGEQMVAYEPLL